MDRTSFLVLHGWPNRRPVGHWQRWLADRLAEDGAQVLYPQLPEPDAPVLDEWLLDLRRYAAAMRGDERVLVCHSLATLLWWTAALSDEPVTADRVLLVAPPAPDFVRGEVVADFVPDGMETRPLDPRLAATVRVVASDGDPYCPGGASALYADRYGLDIDVVPGAGHLDLPAGYGAWPSVLAWCRDPSVRLTGVDGDRFSS
jgi:uncharacterized protein